MWYTYVREKIQKVGMLNDEEHLFGGTAIL